ncbi:MAG: UDP-N-acetylmuramate dehydrogenase [Erysipelotrichaceae bacterium]|nr:UDP-N-acetylmuramate dehydrogenase [Erysipelotrichaceae bacterium]
MNLFEKLNVYGDVLENKSFKELTTLKIGGNAAYVVYPYNLLSLSEVLRIIKEENKPFKLIGKGSNLLCGDDFYDGVIIKLDRHLNEFYFEGTTLVAQAGCSIIQVAMESMRMSLSGLEFASGIPGTVGGTIYMNAGAYKSSMKDVVSEVFVYRDGKLEWISNEECEFHYRHSIFQSHDDWIVLAVRYHLQHKEKELIFNLIEERKKRRIESQPLNFPSAGSVFRNPNEMASWQVIEAIGYRGKQIGGARVSDKHGNFIVNVKQASCKDFLTLVHEIQEKAKEKFNIDLVMEVEKFNCN